MKTIKLSFAAVLLFVATATSAIERPKLNMIPVGNERAVVSVSNEKAAYLEMGIYTANGDMVYYRQTDEQIKDFSKVFDFANLAHGKYIFSFRINDTQVTNDFEVSAKGIHVGEPKVKYDPYFSFENNELKLSYLNFDEQMLSLRIYGKNGLVYKKSLGNEFNVLKGLDLSKLENGTYSVTLNSPDKEFSYNIVK